MADATTSIFGITKPEVGASADTWGGKQNNNRDLYDKLLGAITTGGSSNAYTLTTGQSYSALVANMRFCVKWNHTNSGAATLNVDGIGAVAITKNGTTALASGDATSGQYAIVAYDGTQWQILGVLSGVYQPLDATLTALAALSWSSGSPVVQFTAADTVSLTLTPSVTSITAGSATINGNVYLANTVPRLNFYETDAAANEGRWRAFANGGILSFAAFDDAESASNIFMMVDRTGTTIVEIELNATNIDINGAVDISGATTCGTVSAATSANTAALVASNTNGSLSTGVAFIHAARASNAAFSHLLCTSNNVTDIEYNLRGDGNAYADVAWNGGGADYAEYFEWADANPLNEDRRGISVVLVGEKIRPATHADDPASIIGVVSAMPTVVGDAGWNKWSGKYLKDEYGAYITEPYSTITWVRTGEGDDAESVTHCYVVGELPAGVAAPEDAIITSVDDKGRPLLRRKLNPAYDPDKPYTPREERPEWSPIGFMGKLFVRKGQPVGDRWFKLADVSETIERWLVL